MLGTVWRAPYRLAIGEQLRAGVNTLRIKVANLWVNRLIGDRVNPEKAQTFTSFKSYLPSAPLRASGLIGPVRILDVGRDRGRTNEKDNRNPKQ